MYSNIETNSAPLKLINENLLDRMLVRLRQKTHWLSQSVLLTNFSMIRIFLLPVTLRNTEVFPYIPIQCEPTPFIMAEVVKWRPMDKLYKACRQTKTISIIIHSSVVIYHFCLLVFTDTNKFYSPRKIPRFQMWHFKNINK